MKFFGFLISNRKPPNLTFLSNFSVRRLMQIAAFHYTTDDFLFRSLQDAGRIVVHGGFYAIP